MWLFGCASQPATFDAAYPPAIVEINFQSDGSRLNGIVYVAEGVGPHPTVTLLHGYPGNEKNLDLAQDLRSAGFNVLFFHYRGAWGSEGEYGLTNSIDDVAAAQTMLRSRAEAYRVNPERLILMGHSMGGFAALQSAARDERIGCVAALASADVGAMARAFAASPEARSGFAAYSDSLQMLSGWSGEKALTEIEANAASFEVANLAPALAGKRVLLVAADQDEAVDPTQFHIPMAKALASATGANVEAVILSGDHSFSWSRAELIDTVVTWADGCR